jgi:DNA-directed RNA polymerase subunit N (RpoN/RPB10)
MFLSHVHYKYRHYKNQIDSIIQLNKVLDSLDNVC